MPLLSKDTLNCIKVKVKKDIKKYNNINIKQLFSTLMIIINVSSKNHHMRMISEGSCDTEDWSNDGGNTALHHRIYIYSHRKYLF